MVNAVTLRFVVACVMVAIFGQVIAVRSEELPGSRLKHEGGPSESVGIAEVIAESIEVYDRPDETSYVTGTLVRGEKLRIRSVQTETTGWLAIEPPLKTIFWVEKSATDLAEAAGGRNGHVAEGDKSGKPQPTNALIVVPSAVIRSGNLGARLPGPPVGTLNEGAKIRLMERDPVALNRGKSKSEWLAIAPPDDWMCYVRREGVRLPESRSTTVRAETRAVYLTESDPSPKGADFSLDGIAVAAAREIQVSDEVYESLKRGKPPAQWELNGVRSRLEAVLKSSGSDPRVEEAVRVRLARVTRDEQAAKAARTIESILAESHRRDREVAVERKRIAAVGRSKRRTFSAVGYMQASTEKVDGRKLFVLIGKDGSTVAYLDIPPGLDIERMVAHRVGVRGEPHFNEDLGARLITVRDLEAVDTRR